MPTPPSDAVPAGQHPAAAPAVHNNAVWCDTVCRALGKQTAWVDGLWVNHDPAPPYYSNAVTTSAHETSAQRRRLRDLLGSPLPRPWSVKDGFHVLDLAPLGFRVLFEAQWIRLSDDGGVDPDQVDPTRDPDDVEWSAAASPAELQDWETAWRGENPEAVVAGPPAMFAPALLHDPDLRFLAGRRRARIVAVAAANRSDDGTGPVVGISNLVLGSDESARLRAGAVHAVRAAFPGLPVVGYERGDDLAAMLALGFQATAPLRVWITGD